MKKINVLMPICLGASLITTCGIISCGPKKNTPQDDETKHAHTQYETPVASQDFVVNFSLDEGFALDPNESYVEFGNSNQPIPLSYCKVDTNAKTITIPGSLVTSASVNVDFKSAKQTKNVMSKQDIINALNEVFVPNATRNIAFNKTLLLKTYKPDGQLTQVQQYASRPELFNGYKYKGWDIDYSGLTPTVYEKWQAQDETIGYWRITEKSKDPVTYQANPHLADYLEEYMKLYRIDISTFYDDANYNDVSNTFSFTIESSNEGSSMSATFVFNRNKKVQSFAISEKSHNTQTGNDEEYLGTWNAINRGSISFDVPSEYVKYEFKQTDFTYDSTKEILATNSSQNNEYTRNNIPKFDSTSYPVYDESKETYIELSNLTIDDDDYAAVECVLYNNKTKLVRKSTSEGEGDYYFNYGDGKKTYIVIDNKLGDNPELFFQFSIVSSTSKTSGDINTIISQK